MSTLPHELAEKVARLLPRLASNFDPEVVNTVRAIGRVLSSGGADLHDLAERVAEGPQQIVVYRERATRPTPPPFSAGKWREAYCPPRGASTYCDRVVRCQNASAGRLNEWEAAFLLSLAQQLERGRNLSPKQVTIFETIAAKLGESS